MVVASNTTCLETSKLNLVAFIRVLTVWELASLGGKPLQDCSVGTELRIVS